MKGEEKKTVSNFKSSDEIDINIEILFATFNKAAFLFYSRLISDILV